MFASTSLLALDTKKMSIVGIGLRLTSRQFILPVTYIQSRDMRTLVYRRMREMYWRSRDFKAIDPPVVPRSQFLEWNYSSELYAFSRRLHEELSEGNLKIAFTHQSYVEHEQERRKELALESPQFDLTSGAEFAKEGRQLISEFSKNYLRYFLPKLPEEGIVALHDFLMETETMAEMSKLLGTRDLIVSSEEFPTDQALADTLAAVIGVMAKEKGVPHTNKFIIDFIMTYLQDKQIFEIWDLEDPKSVLNTILHNEGLPSYEPRLQNQVGVSTLEPSYAVGLYVNKKLLGRAICESIEEAEVMAAFDALALKFEIRPSDFVFKYGPEAYDLDFTRFSKENKSINSWHDVQGKFTENRRLDG